MHSQVALLVVQRRQQRRRRQRQRGSPFRRGTVPDASPWISAGLSETEYRSAVGCGQPSGWRAREWALQRLQVGAALAKDLRMV